MTDITKKMFLDPVCGMEINRGDPDTLISSYKGQPYYFCAQCCVRVFKMVELALLAIRSKLQKISPASKEVMTMKRFMIPRVAHCSNGCLLQSWARR
jgi:YHS domain-containing protein